MNKFKDMTGEKFGRLTVIERVPNLPNSRVTRWKCLCECGNIIYTNRNNLIHNKVKSCGCLAKELAKERFKKYNKYIKKDNYYVGYTSNTHKKFYIDFDDYDNIKEHCWYEMNTGYCATKINGKIITLHKYLMNKGKIVDHINRNKLDNRKNNLRYVNSQQNAMNKSKQSNNTSGVTGVFYCKNRKKWVSQITINKKSYIKRFDTKEEAIKFRKECEKIYFKEYARN